MTEDETRDYQRLLNKAQEAFVLAIELFNRPTIRYRVEGCAFFLCNAWELMLKAYIIKRDGYSAIFYPGKSQRTLSLEDCLKKVMTNEHDPVRKNIESICELRNTSTHFVVPEYEITYAPLFQADIVNFDNRMRTYHGIEVCDSIPDNYLTLSVNRTDINGETIRAKYTQEVAERLLSTQASIDKETDAENSTKYAVLFQTQFILSKKSGIPVRIDKTADTGINIVKQLVDPNDRYPYRRKEILAAINKQLERKGVQLTDPTHGQVPFNSYHFDLFAKCYNMKAEERYAYDRSSREEKNASYIYSQAVIDLIVEEVVSDPEHIIEKLRNKLGRMGH